MPTTVHNAEVVPIYPTKTKLGIAQNATAKYMGP